MSSAGRSLVRKAPTQIVALIGSVAVVAMVVNILLDVTMRNLANSPVAGTLEHVTYWYMVGISFSGMVIAQVRGEQIRVTLLTDRLRPASFAVVSWLGTVVSTAFLLGVVWVTWEAALEKAAISEYIGVDRVLIWPMRFIVPAALLAVAVALVLTTHAQVRERLRKTDQGSAASNDIQVGVL